MDIELFLKNSLNIEKEAWATAEALESLILREDSKTNALIEEYSNDLTYMEKTSTTATDMIHAIPEENVKHVFIARYLHKLTWPEIAKAAFLSVSQTQRLHKKGLDWLEENYTNIPPKQPHV
ncbi:MAG: hypothetical protein FWC76_03475 [Defluviitaleaceae bacterium]|nr:hypothetical protein [Defluviitaleaceae bacterium]